MNLVICHTPLQVFLFEKIKERYPDEKFHCVAYFDTKSKKNMFYFSKLKGMSDKYTEIFIKPGIGFLYELIINRMIFLFRKYDKVFISSIDSILIHSILTSINFNSLFTFDDGTANIFPTSMFFVDHRGQKERVLSKLLCLKYDTESIKEISNKHYSIFHFKNIIDNVEYVPLINLQSLEKVNDKKYKHISVLLGQPLYTEYSLNVNLFRNLVNEYNIDYYIPHPREKYIVSDVKYMNTNLIFEEYIINLLQEYEKVTVYTIYSSAVFSLLAISNVEVRCIRVNDFSEEQKIMEKYNIPFMSDLIC